VNAREFLRDNFRTINVVYLDHDAGVDRGMWVCPCGYRCTEAEWERHVADKIADRLDQDAGVELHVLFEPVL
jgi:hypothetical protein